MKISRDLVGGSLFLLLGTATIIVARDYDFGTTRQPGAGFLPTALGGLLVLLSGLTIVRDLMRQGPALGRIEWRPLAMVLLAIAMFGLLLEPLGLPLAIMATVLIGSLASPALNIVGALCLGLGLSAGSTLLFVVLLGQQMPLVGSLFERLGG